jgi:hypothetical protein
MTIAPFFEVEVDSVPMWVGTLHTTKLVIQVLAVRELGEGFLTHRSASKRSARPSSSWQASQSATSELGTRNSF